LLSCDTSEASKMRKWWARIRNGKELEHLGTLEAANLREAYLFAIEKFNVPKERQNRLFVKAEER
jgi:hypothetical protein